MESIKAGDAIKILALEQTFERILNHPTLPFPVLIKECRPNRRTQRSN
jgi:hypothetical protein